MTTEKTYNGWTNYATWRVNLEIFDGMELREMGWHRMDTYSLSQTLKEYAEEIIESDCKEGLALDYARAFLSDVNWYEISGHLISDYVSEDNEDEDEEIAA